MQDAKAFEKQAKLDFSKTRGRRLRLRVPIRFPAKANRHQNYGFS
jgi:hypothetical protein